MARNIFSEFSLEVFLVLAEGSSIISGIISGTVLGVGSGVISSGSGIGSL